MIIENDIFISYIVPCYNVESYLYRCLDSLICQKIDCGFGIEFILINDGSKDNTLAELKVFADKEDRAIVIDQKNKGVSSARNSGLKVAKGKYVFFLDSDDWLTENASQILYDVCCCGQPDIVITNAYVVNEGALDSKYEWNPILNLPPGLYDTMDFARNISSLPISFKAYRRELLVNNNVFYDEKLQVGEVYTFFINALTHSHQIAFTDERVMNYLVRNSSVMRTINIERDITIVDTMHYIDNYAVRQMPVLRSFSSYKRSLFDLIIMFGIYNYLEKCPYSSEVGMLIKRIKREKIYSDLQKYFIYKDFTSKRRTMYALLFSLLPVPLIYRILRFRLKNL